MACLNQWPFHQSSWQEPTNKCQAATVNTSVVEETRSLNWATWNTISSVLSTSHQFVHVWCAWNMVSATWFSMHARSMHVAIHGKNCHTMTHVCHDFNVFEHIGWCQLGLGHWLASQSPNQVDNQHVDNAWCQTVQFWTRKMETSGCGTPQQTQQSEFHMYVCTKWQHDVQLDNSWVNAFSTSPN